MSDLLKEDQTRATSIPIMLTTEDRSVLVGLARSRTAAARRVTRAPIVLAAASHVEGDGSPRGWRSGTDETGYALTPERVSFCPSDDSIKSPDPL